MRREIYCFPRAELHACYTALNAVLRVCDNNLIISYAENIMRAELYAFRLI
jgi:hypothetical protein